MIAPPPNIVHDPNVLLALRELLSQYPAMAHNGPETLGRALYMLRFLSHRPDTFAVEAALDALRVEGELLA